VKIDPRLKDMVMATKLSSGEHLISFVNIVSQNCFILVFPYLLENGNIAGEFFPGTLNRIFPISPEDCMFTKTMNPRFAEEFLALIQLDYDDAELMITQLTESLDVVDDIPEGTIIH
jgi:hypothetical protein